MTIEVNGRSVEIAPGTSVHDLLVGQTGSTRGSAVVVDDEVVPRSRWQDTPVVDGQRIELITATQGG